MEWVTTIQKAITYIENHLLDPINYDDVASHVCMSSYELHRTFSFLTGMTVATYIRNRRLSLAGIEIVETNTKIIDIALKYGYETSESFTKAFTRFHGYAPKYVRDISAKLVLFNPLVIKIAIEGGKSMDYRIVTNKKQKFLAVIRKFKNEIINDKENHDIPYFWDECIKNKIIDRLTSLTGNNKNLYGLCSPCKEGETTFDYGIGILIEEENNLNIEELNKEGFDIWEVEEGTFAVFNCFGDDPNCISNTWSKFYKEFLPQTGFEVRQSTDYEVYPSEEVPNLFCELWIPIKNS